MEHQNYYKLRDKVRDEFMDYSFDMIEHNTTAEVFRKAYEIEFMQNLFDFLADDYFLACVDADNNADTDLIIDVLVDKDDLLKSVFEYYMNADSGMYNTHLWEDCNELMSEYLEVLLNG